MAGIFSDHTLQDFLNRNPRVAHVASASGTGENVFGAVLQTVEFVGVAGTMSYLNMRHAAPGRQAYEVAGVPADLALGLLFSGLSLSGYFGKHASHGVNVGSGFLAAYACRMGATWGAAAKAQFHGAPVRGAFAAPPLGTPNYQTTEPTQPVAQYPWAA